MTTPRARNQAFTLVELLIVMSAASTLMLLAIGMIHRAMQLESQGRRRAQLGRTAIRLSTEFRRDIHAGRSVSIESGASGAISTGAIPGIRAADAERTTLHVGCFGPGRCHDQDRAAGPSPAPPSAAIAADGAVGGSGHRAGCLAAR